MGCSKSSSKREVNNNTTLSQERRKVSNKQISFTPKETRERKNQTQSQQKKIKIRVETNGNRERKQQKRSMKLKAGSLKRQTNFINFQPDSVLKLIKSEMKKKLQLTPQKYKGSKDITTSSCMLIKWTEMEEIDRFLERYNLPRLN